MSIYIACFVVDKNILSKAVFFNKKWAFLCVSDSLSLLVSFFCHYPGVIGVMLLVTRIYKYLGVRDVSITIKMQIARVFAQGNTMPSFCTEECLLTEVMPTKSCFFIYGEIRQSLIYVENRSGLY
ncbi:Uncharacterised protein [Serratia quinivorans]|jgi:hypothetical protein|uniref:Uncharacterized protein n=1 Tax=Serratia quinivorans TaxID=137545 RepID=A0A379ZIU7_9GAMM|nr:hypothetical protein [Serratia sp. BIGb0163]RYM60446.1 hypothetical protein BSR03_15720 [Serratia proteamaculans]CAI1870252.1 Uncharacterised protein [Serratia quinivorans]CAI1876612.1 Uncharacterised protein [Serratia quinivorans]CAI1977103.1 Uncharacterised protein [Serratia quinivorans]